MTYFVKPIPFKPPRLVGLSERLLDSHYENNYGGAVRRLNAIDTELAGLQWPTVSGFEINGLKREELIAANSMILHEVYFDGLGGEDGLGGPAVEPDGPLADALERDFGSTAEWRQQFTAMGKALAGGSGWVILSWSPRKMRLDNHWAADHTHTLADGVPILALDMYEHAYHLDFGANAAAYVDAYMGNLHWGRPASRFAAAVGNHSPGTEPDEPSDAISPEALRELVAHGDQPVLIDVCIADDLSKRHDKLPGAQCLQAENMAQWIATLPKDKKIVAYCMYGYQVSGNAVAELRERGFAAQSLAGGISAWRAIGGATEPYKP